MAWAENICLDGVDEFQAYAWEPAATIAVVGLGQDVERELYDKRLREDGIHIMRRASGGGAVILRPGVLCFGVIAPPQAVGGQYDIHATFRGLCEPVLAVLRGLGLRAVQAGISDLAVELSSDGQAIAELRKVAGCAQLRKKRAVLVHGSLLVSAELADFSRYLRFPSKVPDYRDSRSHEDFCCNLQAILDRSVDAQRISTLMRQAVNARGWQWREVPDNLPAGASVLLKQKYMNPEWNLYRRR